MISNQQSLNLSPYMAIYDIVVPKDNMLRQINDLVDFSFVLDELQNKYCLDNGRNAVPPVRMFKYLLLKSIFDLSDVDVVERSKYDMSFKYFLDMAPEDSVINPSSLTKFRKLRLQELIEKSRETGMEIETVIGDTAYSEKDNIQYAKENELQLVSKLHPLITNGTRKKEDEFEFNKDAGMYVCKAGHMAIRKSRDREEKSDGKNQSRNLLLRY